MNMRNLCRHVLHALLAAGACASALAADVATDPIGYVTVTCLANSDTRLNPPLMKAAAFTGTVASVASNVVTFNGSNLFAASQFVYAAGTQPSTYFAIFGSGAKNGMWYQVSANDTTSVTLDLAGDSITSVVAGDSVRIIPFWTLATVFPASDAGVSFIATTNVFSKQTEIYVPDSVGQGINRAPATVYYFYNGAWRKAGQQTSVSFDDTPLSPDSYIILRNKAAQTSVTISGAVNTGSFATPLSVVSSSKNDNYVAQTRPVDVSLNNLGLITSGAFEATTNVFSKKDELYVYDNSAPGINKAPSAIFYYYNGAWRQNGQATTLDVGSTVIPAGSGFIIRKAPAAQDGSVIWTGALQTSP